MLNVEHIFTTSYNKIQHLFASVYKSTNFENIYDLSSNYYSLSLKIQL